MQYLGGKSAIASSIASFIEKDCPERGRLIEPFMGGGAMTAALAPLFKEVVSSDIHPDLILMWQALKEGWKPPSEISETEYKDLKSASPSALRGFAGFGCSYGGKWFGGFARNSAGTNYAEQSKRGLIKDMESMNNVTFINRDFSKINIGEGDTVYADPPYVMTAKYSNAFSSHRFWFFVRKWCEAGARVYVSEYRAPRDFQKVWEREFTGNMKSSQVAEALFVWKGKQCTT